MDLNGLTPAKLMQNITLFEYEDEASFWQTAREDVILSIKETLERFPTVRIGLAGGSTPQKLYEMLSESSLNWEKIIWVLLDERYVPSDDEESNLKMVRNSLFKKASIPPENIVSFDTSLSQESAAKEMSRKLIDLTHERFPLFDLLVLGVGADGHIASLFEGDRGVGSLHYASIAHAQGQKTERRLTTTPIALRSASQGLVLLFGETKRVVYEALKALKESETGQKVLPQPPFTALKILVTEVPLKVLFYGGSNGGSI